MKHYTFNSHTPDSMRDSVVISLRKDGYVAYRETNTLVTNATLLGIALSCGTSTVIA